jgi:ferredoxin
MEKSKEFLFNEFLKEEALIPEPQVETAIEISKPETINYRLPLVTEVTDERLKSQWRIIRNYFRTGEKPAGDTPKELVPLLLAPFVSGKDFVTDYPYFLPEDADVPHDSFSNLLKNQFSKTFSKGEANILFKRLPKLENAVRKFVSDAGSFCPLSSALDFAFGELSKIKINGDDKTTFFNDMEKFKSSLPKRGMLIEFSPAAPVRMLAHLLKHQHRQKRKIFISKIHRLSSALQDLADSNENKKSGERTLDFAGSLIEFKKLDTLMPESASVAMPAKRRERIRNCIKQLNTAEQLLQTNGVIFIGKALSENSSFRWKEYFDDMEIKTPDRGKCCLTVFDGFRKHIEPFVRLMSAVRIAEIELKGRFDEDIHSDYFSKFNWHYFTDEEITLCPPVLLIEETENLLGEELSHFSSLIAWNKPVKIIALQKPFPFGISKNGNDADDPVPVEQELIAIAISHRNTFTHQSSAHHPSHLVKGLEAGLNSPAPGLFHFLIPASFNTSSVNNFLTISTAVEGRQFPLFTYNVSGEKWGSRFDITANTQSENDWPKYSSEILNANNEIEKHEFTFTFCDSHALSQSGNNLLSVPAAFWTNDLVEAGEYLRLPAGESYSKVPFIWQADKENILNKTVVPYALIAAARERLEFWNFIQELGGIKSYHVEQAVNRTRTEMLEQKEKEITELREKSERKIEEARLSAAGEAMSKLADVLLDIDNLVLSAAPKKISEKKLSAEIKEEKPAESSVAAAPVNETAVVSSEPWIETFRCTSCNDCVDKFPRAFKYNSDKQAYVADVTTVTYAQIVQAAEACPAKCIHPGLPLNPNEPGLAEWTVRAKPFN